MLQSCNLHEKTWLIATGFFFASLLYNLYGLFALGTDHTDRGHRQTYLLILLCLVTLRYYISSLIVIVLFIFFHGLIFGVNWSLVDWIEQRLQLTYLFLTSMVKGIDHIHLGKILLLR